MAKFNKDQKLVYLGAVPYILSNGQQVGKHGDELVLGSDVVVQDGYFEVVNVEPEFDLDALHAKALIENSEIEVAKKKAAHEASKNKK